MRTALLCLISFLPGILQAQPVIEWSKPINVGYGSQNWSAAVAVAPNQDVVTAGKFPRADGYDIHVTRYTSTGTLAMQWIYGAASTTEIPIDLAIAPNGTMAVVGQSAGASLIVLLNTNGTIAWSKKTFPNGTALKVKVDPSGGFVVCGTASGGGFVIRYSPTGAVSWKFLYDTADLDSFNAIDLDAAGNVYVVGMSNAVARIIKLSPQGVRLWQRGYYGPVGAGEVANIQLRAKPAGGCYVTGTELLAGNHNVFTASYTDIGALSWRRIYDSSSGLNDYGMDLDTDSAGNLYVGILTQPELDQEDLGVLKYTSSGVRVWVKRYASTARESFSDLRVAGDGTIYLCGSNSASKGLVLKYAGDGTRLWNYLIASAYAGSSQATAIATDSSNAAYVFGMTPSYLGTDSLLIKMR